MLASCRYSKNVKNQLWASMRPISVIPGTADVPRPGPECAEGGVGGSSAGWRGKTLPPPEWGRFWPQAPTGLHVRLDPTEGLKPWAWASLFKSHMLVLGTPGGVCLPSAHLLLIIPGKLSKLFLLPEELLNTHRTGKLLASPHLLLSVSGIKGVGGGDGGLLMSVLLVLKKLWREASCLREASKFNRTLKFIPNTATRTPIPHCMSALTCSPLFQTWYPLLCQYLNSALPLSLFIRALWYDSLLVLCFSPMLSQTGNGASKLCSTWNSPSLPLGSPVPWIPLWAPT